VPDTHLADKSRGRRQAAATREKRTGLKARHYRAGLRLGLSIEKRGPPQKAGPTWRGMAAWSRRYKADGDMTPEEAAALILVGGLAERGEEAFGEGVAAEEERGVEGVAG